MVVCLTGVLHCANAEEAFAVQQNLPEHLRLTRAEVGCLRFDVVARADGLTWQVDESFVDQPAFEAHQLRTKGTIWATATAGLRRDFKVWQE